MLKWHDSWCSGVMKDVRCLGPHWMAASCMSLPPDLSSSHHPHIVCFLTFAFVQCASIQRYTVICTYRHWAGLIKWSRNAGLPGSVCDTDYACDDRSVGNLLLVWCPVTTHSTNYTEHVSNSLLVNFIWPAHLSRMAYIYICTIKNFLLGFW